MSSSPSIAGETTAREERDRLTRSLLLEAELEACPARRQGLMERAILLNQPMAKAVAVQYQRRGVDPDDLIQVAMLGLVKAIQGYCPEAQNAFAAYAVPTIRGEIKRHFRDRSWLIRPPRALQELSQSVRMVEADLAQRLQRTPTSEDVAQHLGVDAYTVNEAREAGSGYQGLTLDGPLGRTGRLSYDVVADPDDPFERVDALLALRPAMAVLEDRERRILQLRFVDNLNQEQIGRRIGVSQMQVSRLLSNILAKLRRCIEDPRAA